MLHFLTFLFLFVFLSTSPTFLLCRKNQIMLKTGVNSTSTVFAEPQLNYLSHVNIEQETKQKRSYDTGVKARNKQ